MLPPRCGSQEWFFGLRTWAKQTRTIYKQEDHRDTIKSRYLLGVNPTFIRPHPFLIGQYHSTEASVSLSLFDELSSFLGWLWRGGREKWKSITPKKIPRQPNCRKIVHHSSRHRPHPKNESTHYKYVVVLNICMASWHVYVWKCIWRNTYNDPHRGWRCAGAQFMGKTLWTAKCCHVATSPATYYNNDHDLRQHS